MRVGLYARVPTYDRQTLPMQLSARRDYAMRLDISRPPVRRLLGQG